MGDPDSSPDIGPDIGLAGSKSDTGSSRDSSREKVQGIYIGLDEFNRLIEERGADVDTSYLYKVSIHTTLYYTYTYTHCYYVYVCMYTYVCDRCCLR